MTGNSVTCRVGPWSVIPSCPAPSGLGPSSSYARARSPSWSVSTPSPTSSSPRRSSSPSQTSLSSAWAQRPLCELFRIWSFESSAWGGGASVWARGFYYELEDRLVSLEILHALGDLRTRSEASLRLPEASTFARRLSRVIGDLCICSETSAAARRLPSESCEWPISLLEAAVLAVKTTEKRL